MPRVRFLRERKEVNVPRGASLAQAMRASSVGLDRRLVRACAGRGLCGGCRVLVREGEESLSPRTWIERLRMALGFFAIGHEEECRLACQARVEGDVLIEVAPPFNWWGQPVRYPIRDCD